MRACLGRARRTHQRGARRAKEYLLPLIAAKSSWLVAMWLHNQRMTPYDPSFSKTPPQISDGDRPHRQRSALPWRWPRLLDLGAPKTKKQRITDEMKVVVVKKQNPHKPGTAIFKRGQYVLNADGKTVADAKKGLDGCTDRAELERNCHSPITRDSIFFLTQMCSQSWQV
jgi:hypothetical protein